MCFIPKPLRETEGYQSFHCILLTYYLLTNISKEMSHLPELPENILSLIQSEFKKTSKQHQFEELAKRVLESDPELKDRPAELFAAVDDLSQGALRAKENEQTVGFYIEEFQGTKCYRSYMYANIRLD